MKTLNSLVMVCLSFISIDVFAASASCKKIASDRAFVALDEEVSDDCFQKYIQEARGNSDVVYIGFSCDHVGDYQYKAVTEADGASCRIVSLEGSAK